MDEGQQWNLRLSFGGPFATNTTVEVLNAQGSNSLFYQAANDSIMQFTMALFTGPLGSSITEWIVLGRNSLGTGNSGARISATDYYEPFDPGNTYLSVFYQSGVKFEAESGIDKFYSSKELNTTAVLNKSNSGKALPLLLASVASSFAFITNFEV